MRCAPLKLASNPSRIANMRKPIDSARHDRLVAASVLWLVCGAVALLTTLVPVHSQALGWSGAFWSVLAPLALLLVLEPGLPRQVLALLRRPRTRRAAQAIWH